MKVSLSQEGSNSEMASRSHEDYRHELIGLDLGAGRLKGTFRIILRTLRITEKIKMYYGRTQILYARTQSLNQTAVQDSALGQKL
jgi:hypothetical protein